MRILVTGGAGFIGKHLCRRLVADGHRVDALDNFSSSNECKGVIWWDIRDDAFWSDEYDRIYHLACPASPKLYQKDPIKTMMTNVVGSKNMLDLAKDAGARILLASTSEVYGDPEIHPQPEWYRGNVNFAGPRACYDEGKRAAETLFYDYRERGADTRVARIFNTYGPGMRPDDGRVISNFIVGALKNRKIPVYGNGGQTRSFCYIDDMVDGLIRLMESDYTGPVNLGNGDEITILDLAKMVAEECGPCEIINEPLPKDDPTRRWPDLELARYVLGWSPKIQLDEGLRRTITYFRSTL